MIISNAIRTCLNRLHLNYGTPAGTRYFPLKYTIMPTSRFPFSSLHTKFDKKRVSHKKTPDEYSKRTVNKKVDSAASELLEKEQEKYESFLNGIRKELDQVLFSYKSPTPTLETPNVPEAEQKVLRVAIVGEPNAGKSTVLNHFCGTYVSAVSRKSHTTRRLINGYRTMGNTQIIFYDTPGFTYKGVGPSELESLGAASSESLTKADVILVLLDGITPRFDEERANINSILDIAAHLNKKVIFGLTKMDLLSSRLQNPERIRDDYTRAVRLPLHGNIFLPEYSDRLTELDVRLALVNEVIMTKLSTLDRHAAATISTGLMTPVYTPETAPASYSPRQLLYPLSLPTGTFSPLLKDLSLASVASAEPWPKSPKQATDLSMNEQIVEVIRSLYFPVLHSNFAYDVGSLVTVNEIVSRPLLFAKALDTNASKQELDVFAGKKPKTSSSTNTTLKGDSLSESSNLGQGGDLGTSTRPPKSETTGESEQRISNRQALVNAVEAQFETPLPNSKLTLESALSMSVDDVLATKPTAHFLKEYVNALRAAGRAPTEAESAHIQDYRRSIYRPLPSRVVKVLIVVPSSHLLRALVGVRGSVSRLLTEYATTVLRTVLQEQVLLLLRVVLYDSPQYHDEIRAARVRITEDSLNRDIGGAIAASARYNSESRLKYEKENLFAGSKEQRRVLQERQRLLEGGSVEDPSILTKGVLKNDFITKDTLETYTSIGKFGKSNQNKNLKEKQSMELAMEQEERGHTEYDEAAIGFTSRPVRPRGPAVEYTPREDDLKSSLHDPSSFESTTLSSVPRGSDYLREAVDSNDELLLDAAAPLEVPSNPSTTSTENLTTTDVTPPVGDRKESIRAREFNKQQQQEEDGPVREIFRIQKSAHPGYMTQRHPDSFLSLKEQRDVKLTLEDAALNLEDSSPRDSRSSKGKRTTGSHELENSRRRQEDNDSSRGSMEAGPKSINKFTNAAISYKFSVTPLRSRKGAKNSMKHAESSLQNPSEVEDKTEYFPEVVAVEGSELVVKRVKKELVESQMSHDDRASLSDLANFLNEGEDFDRVEKIDFSKKPSTDLQGIFRRSDDSFQKKSFDAGVKKSYKKSFDGEKSYMKSTSGEKNCYEKRSYSDEKKFSKGEKKSYSGDRMTKEGKNNRNGEHSYFLNRSSKKSTPNTQSSDLPYSATRDERRKNLSRPSNSKNLFSARRDGFSFEDEE